MSLKPKKLPIWSSRSWNSTGGIDWYLGMKNACCYFNWLTMIDLFYQVGDVKIAPLWLSTWIPLSPPTTLAYTQLSLSLSASISGVLALIICTKFSSHSPSGLSSGSLLSSLTQLRLSCSELGEKRFLRMVRVLLRLSRVSRAL